MKKLLAVLLVTAVLAGCGHRQLDYVATPPPGMNHEQAVAAVEQGFYEDWNTKRRPQSVTVTDNYILLADGIVSDGSSFGSAAAIGNGAIVAGSSRVTTKEMGQRIYFGSIGGVVIYQHKVKKNRFVVIIQGADGGELRRINARNRQLAERFGNAISYLKAHRR
ncbi:hypothetical protein [Pseudomonas helleri]|uniref:hypothetical protein n=1 Tax=Pseudomonas helleri TaxID=1608996 RepID=UPI003FCF9E89